MQQDRLMPRQLIWRNRSGRIGADRIISRCTPMMAPMVMMTIIILAGVGLMGMAGCSFVPPDHDAWTNDISFDQYCTQRATGGVTVPLCGQDESDRMMVLYAVEQRCRDAEPHFFTDCQFLETEFRRLILCDIDRLIDRSSLFMTP